MSDASGVTLDAVADFLLSNQFLLTGLELLQECSEKNRTDVPPKLKDAFSPSKLEKLIQQDDVVTWAAASNPNAKPNPPEEQGRIALLEYELRQERGNLQTLRTEISALLQMNEQKAKANGAQLVKQAPATLTERRIINFLIKKYMVDSGYHMSAISFSSEVRFVVDLRSCFYTVASSVQLGGETVPPLHDMQIVVSQGFRLPNVLPSPADMRIPLYKFPFVAFSHFFCPQRFFRIFSMVPIC
jgi:deoxycytidylate deaminase